MVEPLKHKGPLSQYWKKFPGASPSAAAHVKTKVYETIIAL